MRSLLGGPWVLPRRDLEDDDDDDDEDDWLLTTLVLYTCSGVERVLWE